ncbi:MAG: acyl-CoA dehydrogenase family protein [Deltaproteobacteria bacterium]|nr:acyl-CoA dehydrogenase family protein [Deltaproteobacteria bacterium]
MQLTHMLTDEQKAIQDMLRKFVDKEIMPIREKLEEDHSLVEGVLQKLVDLGIQKGGYPPEYGGTGPYSMMTRAIIVQELARGDAGIAMSTGTNAGELLGPARHAGNKEVLDKFAPTFCRDKVCYACLSMTDATGGADSENPLFQGRGIVTRAKLDGDEWVINGTKSWPTHAGIASMYLTVCNTDPDAGDDGIALIYVPADAPGLSFGKPETKMGFKTTINASIFYDNVRVPKEYRAAGPGHDAPFYYAAMAGAQWGSSIESLGIAQAAFDIALDYTKDRKSGGKPVREWSMAAGIIADMAIRLEMMRGSAYNFAWMLDHPEDYGPAYTNQMISKASVLRIFASDGCVWIANKAMELMGANGLSPEYHLEKYLRDAKVTQIWLAGQQVARYRVVRGYYDYIVGKPS